MSLRQMLTREQCDRLDQALNSDPTVPLDDLEFGTPSPQPSKASKCVATRCGTLQKPKRTAA